MRGFPPIQIFLLVITFIVLAVPLSHLTGHTEVKPVTKLEKREEKAVKALLRLRYAHTPSTLSVKIGDKELISSAGESPIEVDATIPPPHDGFDVFLAATWPDNTPDTAITLEIEPDGLDARRETRWSSAGSLDEVITFSWK